MLVKSLNKYKEVIEKEPIKSIGKVFNTMYNTYNDSKELTPMRYNDKYKHSYISCKQAQDGAVSAATVGAMGVAKEAKDIYQKRNTPKESFGDEKANIYGIYKGLFNKEKDCDELVEKKYPKYKR